MVQFKFYGGAGEVGKSCILMEHKGYNVMMDCGIKINPLSYPTLPDHTDSLILSHAHLDHCGMIPAFHKKTGAPIYATDITFEISHILQRDSVKINRLREEPSIYSDRDIEVMQTAEVNTAYGEERRLTDDISFELLDAGHIPGSAATLLRMGEKSAIYTGDIKIADSRLLKGAGTLPKADILLIEGTYGDRVHSDRAEMEKTFLETVNKTLERGGTALVPAFAVGRSQEMLMILADIDYPIYLDGMSKRVTSLFLQHPEYLRDAEKLREAAERAHWVQNNSQRRHAGSEPSVIVTTSGMLSGGPILHYLGRLCRDERSSILLTGYQVEGTNGRLMMDEGYVVDALTRRKFRVGMEKYQFDFSAHAGRHSLEKIVKMVDPEVAIVVHGDEKVCLNFAEWLGERCEAHVPGVGDVVEVE